MAKRKRQVPKGGFHAPARLDARKLLRELSDDLRRLDVEQRATVDKARADGASWAEIAKLTGMRSRQAARYRFGPKTDPGASTNKR